MVSILNRNRTEIIQIMPLERIAQLFFVPIFLPIFNVVKEFNTSTRGKGGFGSTGKF
jgi:dUTP pyrophosphatase